jgi:hypothetical protein
MIGGRMAGGGERAEGGSRPVAGFSGDGFAGAEAVGGGTGQVARGAGSWQR